MNKLAFFGIIILIIVLYFMYLYLFTGTTSVSKIYLNGSNTELKFSDLSSPGSTRFSFSKWLYIEQLKPVGNSEILNAGPFQLFVTSDAILKYSINGSSTTIMSNYPLQRWVYVIVSFDNDVVDTYIDGKLLRSQQLNMIPEIGQKNNTISYGTGLEGYISKFERLLYPMDPSTAWSKYMSGAGNITSSASYQGKLSLTKNGNSVSELRIF